MEIKVWRISHKRHSDSLFSGIGAKLYGGRFNSPGSKVVYTSGSLSLAMLELLVQGNKRDRFTALVGATATFDSENVTHMEVSELPKDWNARPPKSSSQLLGDNWLDKGTTLVLRVPSVIVPTEYNYLINPLHPLFSSIIYSEVQDIEFDARLK